MTHEEKIEYMRIAAGICSFGFSTEQMDLLVSLHEEVISNRGDTNLRSLAKIQAEVKQREFERQKEQLKTY